MRAGACLAILASAACVGVQAAPRQPRPDGCATPAWNPPAERLSRLLGDVSAMRAFRPENWSGEDPLVKAAGTDDASLMASLSGQVNLIAHYVPALDCPGRMHVDMIWILPGKPRSPGPAPRASVPAATASQATVGASEAASARMAMGLYLRAHGPKSPDARK